MKKLIQIDELEKCLCFNLRKMARELTNDYNSSLKFSGINSTQIPILAFLNIYNQLNTYLNKAKWKDGLKGSCEDLIAILNKKYQLELNLETLKFVYN